MIRILICAHDSQLVYDLHKILTELYSIWYPPFEITGIINPSNLSADEIKSADIVFLDICMGQEVAISLARRMREINHDFVLLFVGSNVQFSFDFLKENALCCIHKSALEQKLSVYFEHALALCIQTKKCITVPCKKGFITIPVSCLEYAEVYRKTHNLLLHMNNFSSDEIVIGKTISSLENELMQYSFLRIHKSYLVNMNFILSIQSTATQLTSGQILPTSARNYKALKASWLQWKHHRELAFYLS